MHPVVLVGDRLPPRLRDLESSPDALYLRGELPRGPAVAIVGTRSPTAEAVEFTQGLAAELACAGVAILSGGAVGIDTAAHRGALAAQGVTVVVAPAGYDRPFPQENSELFAEIIHRCGAYVALVPDDEPATRASFFARNACLAALAHAVVLVQAGYRSGARNAAARARRLGRPLLVVPSVPWIRRGLGCNAELRAGAAVCERAEDVLKALERVGVRPVSLPIQSDRPARKPARVSNRQRSNRQGASIQLTASLSNELRGEGLEREVLQGVAEGARHVDELCVRTGLPAAVIHRVLLTLSLRGVLVSGPSGLLLAAKSSE
jgi:DNA processing protein